LKNVVYQTPVNNKEDLWARVQDACRMVRRNPGVFERLRRSCRRRAQACVENDGKHVEHLL